MNYRAPLCLSMNEVYTYNIYVGDQKCQSRNCVLPFWLVLQLTSKLVAETDLCVAQHIKRSSVVAAFDLTNEVTV